MDLPESWKLSTIGEVAVIIRGVSYKKEEAKDSPEENLIPILRATNIQEDQLLVDSNLVYVPQARVKEEQKLKIGDVVICISSGSKNLVGKTAQLSKRWEGSFGTFCATARFHTNINSRYGGLFFSSPHYRNIIREKSSGININNLRIDDISEIPIPLPPLPEQERIVERIESLLSRLDAGVAGLKRARAALKRYRASVLKAACEGRLVPQDANDEPAADLLARIRGGKEGSALPEGLAELPSGWCWTRIEDICGVKTGATPLRSNLHYYVNGFIPWITSGSLNDLFVNEADELITELAIKETNAKIIPSGSLLVAMYGEGKTRGKVSELRIDAATNQAIAALIFNDITSKFKPYIKTFFQKNYDDVRLLSSGGVQPNLNLSIIKNTLFPFPPVEEQHRIVSEVDRLQTVIDNMENSILLSLARAARLRQSVLKRAFEGRLA